MFQEILLLKGLKLEIVVLMSCHTEFPFQRGDFILELVKLFFIEDILLTFFVVFIQLND